MAYTQTIYDNFATSTLSSSKWTTPDGTTGVTAGGTNCTLAATNSYPAIESVTKFDVTTGIMAAKLTSTGTANGNTVFFFEIIDASGNGVALEADPTSATWLFGTDGAATVGTPTKVISTFWSTWTANDFVGLTMSGTTLTTLKSTDGQTWSEIGHATVGGTFARTAVGFQIAAGQQTGTSTWAAVVDDVSFFTAAAALPGKARKGGTFLTPTAIKVRKGATFVTPTAIKVRKAGAWVTPTA